MLLLIDCLQQASWYHSTNFDNKAGQFEGKRYHDTTLIEKPLGIAENLVADRITHTDAFSYVAHAHAPRHNKF